MTTMIALKGLAGAGKDTIANRLVDNWGYTKLAFADALRDFVFVTNPWVPTGTTFTRLQEVITAVGWDTAKRNYPEIRGLLQRTGTEAGRTIFGPNCWARALKKRWEDQGSPRRVVISDLRYRNEYDVIKGWGFLVWHVYNPGNQGIGLDHSSESSINELPYDLIINNGGAFEDLYSSVDLLAKALEEGHVFQ